MVILHLNIKAGMAISGPPLGPTLGQYGIAIGPFCDSFNEQTLLFKNSYPLNVYLYLNKDGSYNYYIYFPRLVFFLRKLLKKEEGPANTPKYFYFLGYIIMKLNNIHEGNSKLLCRKITEIFKDQSFEIEKIDLQLKYKNVFAKGSFRSLTPELLFETIIFSNISSLEIKGLFYYFFELRDYFIVDYSPFFFFFDYIHLYSEILSKYNFDNLNTNIILLDSVEFSYNIHSLFIKYNNLLKIIELSPRLIDLYSSYYQLEDLIYFECYQMYYLYYYADLLSESNFNFVFLSNYFIGFNFNFFSFFRSFNSLENPLALVILNDFLISNYSIILNDSLQFNYLIENDLIFLFSMYTSLLYFSQYEYYTDYDFRDISKCQNRYKQVINYLEHQGLFLITRSITSINTNIFFRNQHIDSEIF